MPISVPEHRYIFSVFPPCFLPVSFGFHSSNYWRKAGVNKRYIWRDIKDAQRSKKPPYIWILGDRDNRRL
jgi:hypothetical protein